MKQKIGFGTALPDGGWQFMATKDPAPRIPFCVEEPVSKGEAQQKLPRHGDVQGVVLADD